MEESRMNQQTVQELNALIETHLDAVATVKKAMEGLIDGKLRQDATDMVRDHDEAVSYLGGRVRELGGEAASSEHATNILKESWQNLWKGGEIAKCFRRFVPMNGSRSMAFNFR